MTNIIQATFEARDIIAAEVSPVPGTDLIEILAHAIVEDGADDMTLEEVTALVITVAKQRTES